MFLNTRYVNCASLVVQLVKNPPDTQETPVWFLGWEICQGRDRLPTPLFLGFPGGSAGKEPTCNVGDLGSIPGLGRSPGEGKGYPLQYSGLGNSVHGVTKSQTWLNNFHFQICQWRLRLPWLLGTVFLKINWSIILYFKLLRGKNP